MSKIRSITGVAVAVAILFQVAAAFGAEAQPPAPGTLVVNINEATAEQLQSLPRIGPSKAQAIVTHRQKRPFGKVEDLMKVKGIGRKTFIDLKPYLSIKGPTTVPSKKTAH